MSLVVPENSGLYLLSLMIGKTSNSDGLRFRLFVNDIHPVVSTRREDLKEPGPESGYAPIIVSPEKWQLATERGFGAKYEMLETIFKEKIGPVHGYFMTDSHDRLLWVERFNNGPYIIDVVGDKIQVQPTITFG